MEALIVHESSFGNTAAVAERVRAGYEEVRGAGTARVVRADEATSELPADLRVLVVAAPTHGFSLPTAASRAQAVRDKGAPGPARTRGVREWISQVDPAPAVHVVTIDTVVRMPLMPGRASKAAAKALSRRGFRDVLRGPGFAVQGMSGPLAPGQDDAALALGRDLAQGAAVSAGVPGPDAH